MRNEGHGRAAGYGKRPPLPRRTAPIVGGTSPLPFAVDVAQCLLPGADCLPHRAFNSYGPALMLGKKPKFPGAFSRVSARFDQKPSKRGAFCLTHFNIRPANRPSRDRISNWEAENRHFRGSGGNAFSQNIENGA
jgi:hypothetical protein